MTYIYLLIPILPMLFIIIILLYIGKKPINQQEQSIPDILDDYYQHVENVHIPPDILKCDHSGDKTLVTESVACGCEQVNVKCDNCGTIIKKNKLDC